MGLITKGEIVTAPFHFYDPVDHDAHPIDISPINISISPIEGGIALTNPQEFTPLCPICNQPVLLETCKADEQGRAVHEQCYAMKVTQHQTPQSPLES